MLETSVQTNEQNKSTAVESAIKPDVMEQLAKPEVQQALSALVDQLPKITEMVTLLTKTYDLAQQVATDRVLIKDTLGGIQEVMQPLTEKAKFYATAAMEANERAERQETTIGLFGMLKLLKDPELQRMLRFGQAYLDVLGERKRQG